jgi:protein N-terminal amidase
MFAGTGFSTFHLPSPLNTLTIGICMDLNPQSDDWSLRDGPYELAQHCVATKSNVLLMLNAWLDSQADTEETCDWQTLNYWAARLRPLWCESNDGHDTSDDRDTTTVVMCNRAGHDEGMHDVEFTILQADREGLPQISLLRVLLLCFG